MAAFSFSLLQNQNAAFLCHHLCYHQKSGKFLLRSIFWPWHTYPIHTNQLEAAVLFSVYLTVLEDKSDEEQFIDVFRCFIKKLQNFFRVYTRRPLYVRAFFQLASRNSF